LDCDGSPYADFLTDTWLRGLLDHANRDAELVDRARDLRVRILLDTGEKSFFRSPA